MKIKLITFDKHVETPETFEKRASEEVARLGEITSLSVQVVEGKVLWKFIYTEKPCEQQFYILTWLDTGNAEGILNNVVSQIERDGKTVMSLDLTFFTTKRVLASVLVKVEPTNDIVNDSSNEAKEDSKAQDGQESKQNEDAPVKPNIGAKRQRRGSNRKPTDG